MRETLGRLAVVVGISLTACFSLTAQSPISRVQGEIRTSERVELANTVTHRPATSTALGHLDGSTKLTAMGLVLKPSDAQEAALEQLLVDQQNPASASYHQWLTPAQFGARFGASDADIAKISTWLATQGLQVESVPAGKNVVFFSGSSNSVESAFGVTMERYRRGSQDFFENSGNLQVPAALSNVIAGVTSLSSYRLGGHAVKQLRADATTARPDYTTTGTNGAVVHYLTPYDFRQIYGMTPLISSGFNGAGITITVLGQSAVSTTQIADFQALTGQTAKAPTITLVPNSGTSAAYSGDEGESEIDLEYALGTAPGAAVNFVYTGSGNNNGVFDAMIYAISNKIGQILTLSYGGCEADFASYAPSTFEPMLRQSNAQGQTILVATGDDGAAACDGIYTNTPGLAAYGLTVSYPASSPYVTAVGGTTFVEGSSSAYWSSTNNSQNGSETGVYIPETTWNDSTSTDFEGAGGGGFSKLFGKPSWQTGPGVPADGHRDIPDVSFAASSAHDAYVYCSAEATNESCTTSAFGLYVVGGTSLATPNFAAMLATVSQAIATTGGLGNVNPKLYALAAGSSATSVFHDVTTGSNKVACVSGSPDCIGVSTIGYSAGANYDQATGLGSVSGSGLAAAFTASTTLAQTTATLSITSTPVRAVVNSPVSFTAAVVATSTRGTPTGSVTFAVDGGTPTSAVTLSASGVGSYTYSPGFTTAGLHTVVVTYSGDGNYSGSTATLTVTVATTGGFALTTTTPTITATNGTNTATGSLTVTPANGFNGNVVFEAQYSSTSTFNGCLNINPVSLASGSAATTTFQVYTVASACTSTSIVPQKTASATKAVAANRSPSLPKGTTVVLAASLLGLFALRRQRRLASLLAVVLSLGLVMASGCSSGTATSGGTSATTGSAGTFVFTITGYSFPDYALTSATTVTVTVK